MDLLDELEKRTVDSSAVVGETQRRLSQCPFVLSMRVSTVYIDCERTPGIIKKFKNVIDATANVTLLTDIEINCKNPDQYVGTAPACCMTDKSVYLCFGFDHTFKTVYSLKRFLNGLVRATEWKEVGAYDYCGMIFYCPKDGRTHKFYNVANFILDENEKSIEEVGLLLEFLRTDVEFESHKNTTIIDDNPIFKR